MTPDEMAALAREMRAGIVAHAIRLGKRLQPGQVVDFLMDFRDAKLEDIEAGRLDKYTSRTDPRRVHFIVEQADIDAGRQLINDQRAKYREPKLTIVHREPKE